MNIKLNLATDHKIKISTHEIQVCFVEPNHPALDGDQGCYRDYVIYINKSNPESMRLSTYIHEFMHAVEDIYIFSIDHVKLNILAEGIGQVLHQNKQKK
jgi:Zn-dependent peptidase ImmA (M78 family)